MVCATVVVPADESGHDTASHRPTKIKAVSDLLQAAAELRKQEVRAFVKGAL